MFSKSPESEQKKDARKKSKEELEEQKERPSDEEIDTIEDLDTQNYIKKESDMKSIN